MKMNLTQSWWKLRLAGHTARKALLPAAALAPILFWTGCGNQFRPVEIPLTAPGPSPQIPGAVIVLSRDWQSACTQSNYCGECVDGTFSSPCPGVTSQIDVSGDADVADVYVGHSPSFVYFSSEIFVTNQADNTVSAFFPSSGGTTPVTAALPLGSAPVYLTQTSTGVYVADSASNTVSVLNSGTNSVTQIIAVGSEPVAAAATNNGGHVYVVNQGDGTVSVISTVDNTVESTISLPSGSKPVSIIPNPTQTVMYVLDSATPAIYVINTFSAEIIATLALPSGGASNSITFEPALQRIYVTNPGNNSVSVFDATPIFPLPPVLLKNITNSALAAPSALAPLPNGGRVYVLNNPGPAVAPPINCSVPSTQGQVLVIDTTSNSVLSGVSIAVGGNPVSIAASADGSKVYVAHQGNGISSGLPIAWAPNTYYVTGTQITDANGCIEVELGDDGVSGSAYPAFSQTPGTATPKPGQAGADANLVWTNAGPSRGTTIIGVTSNSVISETLAPYTDPNCLLGIIYGFRCIIESPVSAVPGT